MLYRRREEVGTGQDFSKAAADRLGHGDGVRVEDDSDVRAPLGGDSGEGGSARGVFGAGGNTTLGWLRLVARGAGQEQRRGPGEVA